MAGSLARSSAARDRRIETMAGGPAPVLGQPGHGVLPPPVNGSDPASPRRVAMVRAGVCVAVLAAITVGVFSRHLFLHWTFPWDFLGKFSASPAFVADTVGRGNWTEWAASVGGGVPAPVDTQVELYNPLWWLLGALHIAPTLGILTKIQVLHVLVGAAGVLALARARGVEWRWALTAGVAYVFFGGFYGNGQHADLFRGFAYAPWLLWSLTLPAGRWYRLGGVPLIAWLIAAGAYPGQLVAFAVVGGVYAGGEVLRHRDRPRSQTLLPLALVGLASLAIAVAIVLPYEHAMVNGDLYRPSPPTVLSRALGSLSPRDVLGLYLNDFAWNPEGSVQAWAVGIPALVGLAGVGLAGLRRHLPLAAAGLVGLAAAMLPGWQAVGRIIDRIPLLFPSRFPAADYKAPVAVALLVLSVEGWRRLVTTHARRWALAAAGVGVLLALGVALAPLDVAPPPLHAVDPTKHAAAAYAAILLAVGIAAVRWSPRGSLVAAGLVAALVVGDGMRMATDWEHQAGQVPWARAPDTLSRQEQARIGAATLLPAVLANVPASRPARLAPAAPISQIPGGSNVDTDGYLGLGYHLSDYGGTVLDQRLRVESDPGLEALMLAPWTAWSFSCDQGRCGGGPVSLPPPGRWTAEPGITSLAYGLDSIRYHVHLIRPALMVENEIYYPGWTADHPGVAEIEVDRALRGWTLPAGDYLLTTSYRQPERTAQQGLVLLALLTWAAAGLLLMPGAIRLWHHRPSPGP